MLEKVIVFGATAEGRKIAAMLADGGVASRLCADTGYGEQAMPPRGLLSVTAKRLDTDEMSRIIKKSGCELVVDTTHPYAAQASANIREACERSGVELIRLIRENHTPENVVEVPDARQAAALLNKNGEKALLMVGSRDLSEFTRVRGYERRLFVRVPPTVEALQKCLAEGYSSGNLICMQGPFTSEMNAATIRMLGVSCIVTKASGNPAGLFEKLSAIGETGCRMILIRRPVKPGQGLYLSAITAMLSERFELKPETGPEAPAGVETVQPFFPFFVRLGGKRATIIGGGDTAFGRAGTLLKFGAEIRIISPEVSEQIAGLVRENKAAWLQSEFAPQLLEGADLVIAATNAREVNHAVGKAAKHMKILVDVADCREECSFLFPEVVRSKGVIAGVVSDTDDGTAEAAVRNKGIVAGVVSNAADNPAIKKITQKIREMRDKNR